MLDAFLRRMQQPTAAAPAGPVRTAVAAGAQS